MRKGEVLRALGTASSSWPDGVAAAVLHTDGTTISAFAQTAFRPYTAAERAVLRAAKGCWQDTTAATAADEVEHAAHAAAAAGMSDVAIAGFMGRTLAQDPAGRRRHRAGSGAAMARALGVPVAWDFCGNDLALGGHGAPMDPFYHFALARHFGARAPLAFLHLGRVSTITWVDPDRAQPTDPGALLAFDVAPGRAAIETIMRRRTGPTPTTPGRVDRDLVAATLRQRFFARMPPKLLDPEADDALSVPIAQLQTHDALATLLACITTAIAQAVDHFPSPPTQLLVAGGGRRHSALMAQIAAALALPVAPVETRGLDGDMLRAQATAFLAVRVARGLPTSCPGTTGVAAAVGGGQISRL